MLDKFSDMFEFPLPDDVKKTIEEILMEEGAKKELVRIALLNLIKRKGGGIRLSSNQSKSLDNLEQVINVSSRYVEKYQDHTLVEGAILLSPHMKIGEEYDFEILFMLSDSGLPPMMEEWRKGMGDTPIRGLWDEWEIFNDMTLPHDEDKFEGKIIHPMFMTSTVIKNEVAGAQEHPTLALSLFQYGVTIYDKKGLVKKIIGEILPPAEEYFKYWKERKYGEFENLLWSLESFLEQGDTASAEIVSVDSVKTFLELMFAVDKKIEPHQHPGSKRILSASRKYLSPEIVEQVEKVLATHNLLERFRLLQELRSCVAEKDEWMKEFHKNLMRLKRE